MTWLKERWAALRRIYRESWEAEKARLKRDYRSLRTTAKSFFKRAAEEETSAPTEEETFAALEKETFVVTVGVVEGAFDRRRGVTFEGLQVAQRVRAEGLKRITETLYWIGYGSSGYKRFLIHTRVLYRTKGLRTMLDLREVREADLALGKYSPLGRLRPRNWGEVGTR